MERVICLYAGVLEYFICKKKKKKCSGYYKNIKFTENLGPKNMRFNLKIELHLLLPAPLYTALLH